MSKLIVFVKTTYQTSEDTWERAALTATFDPTEPIESIIDWAKSKQGDLNTIQLHVDDRKEVTNATR